jgi:hypothetical protein
MKETITKYQFSDEMLKHGFSYEGAIALFEYFEAYEEDTGEQMEFDPEKKMLSVVVFMSMRV